MYNKRVIYIFSIIIVIGLLFLINQYQKKTDEIIIGKFKYLFETSDTDNFSVNRITAKKVELYYGSEVLNEQDSVSSAIKG